MSRQPAYLHSSQNYYNTQPQQQQQQQSIPSSSATATPLQFYSAPTGPGSGLHGFYGQSDGSGLDGTMGTMAPQAGGGSGGGTGYGGNIVATGPWWTAFGPGGVEGELPLLEGQFLAVLTITMLI